MKICNKTIITRSKNALSIICNMIKFRPTVCWPRYHVGSSRKRGWHASDVILIDDHVRIIHARKMQMCVCMCARAYERERERERRRGSGTMRSVRPSFVDEPLDLAIDQTSRCKLSSFFLSIWAEFRGDKLSFSRQEVEFARESGDRFDTSRCWVWVLWQP